MTTVTYFLHMIWIDIHGQDWRSRHLCFPSLLAIPQMDGRRLFITSLHTQPFPRANWEVGSFFPSLFSLPSPPRNIFFFKFLMFIFIAADIVETDVCPCGPLIRIGRAKIWRKKGETNVSSFFFLFLLYLWEKGVWKGGSCYLLPNYMSTRVWEMVLWGQ